MSKPNRNYFSFLLRGWREDDEADWRFSLEGAFGGERIHFSDFAGLIAFLANQASAKAKGRKATLRKKAADDTL